MVPAFQAAFGRRRRQVTKYLLKYQMFKAPLGPVPLLYLGPFASPLHLLYDFLWICRILFFSPATAAASLLTLHTSLAVSSASLGPPAFVPFTFKRYFSAA